MQSISEIWDSECLRADEELGVHIRAGFHSAEDILDLVLDAAAFDLGYEDAGGLDDSDVDAEELRCFLATLVSKRITAYLSEQHGAGDCQALLDSFLQLREEGVLAVHFAGDTQSQALAVVDEQRVQHPGARGYAFFTVQDAELASVSELRIGFGAFEENEVVKVAEQIMRCIRSHGLEATWNGDPSLRIRLACRWCWPREEQFPFSGRYLDEDSAPWLYEPER